MLLKEKTCPPPMDKFGRAGYDAEMQMAFYLRRAFGEAPDIYIFNDLRLERNDEAAQMDHLIMHRHGFVIVESKSVVGKLVVNAQGEFTRIWDGRPRGIPSPIKQAKLQAQLLCRLLNDHKESLRRKVFFGLKQGEFGAERFRVLVAVSDSGVIKREGIDPPELLKADSIADAIEKIIETHAQASGLGSFIQAVTSDRQTSAQIQKDHLPAYTDDEMSAIKSFLLERHTPAPPPVMPSTKAAASPPLVRVAQAPATVSSAKAEKTQPRPLPTAGNAICKHCDGGKLVIAYGRYGYYYKCQDCQGNTPIDLTCSACGKKTRVSKSGAEFRRVCKECGAETPFHTNSTGVDESNSK